MLGDVPVPKKKVKEEKESTYDITLRLLKEGKSVKEIAKIREMSIGTIEGHLAKLVANGTIEIDGYVNKYNKGKILFAFAQLGSHASLADIKNILPRNISYAEIKMVKAELERKG
ncbi:MAG: helix-turn-helix domain-containing protein [Bacteroidaceae bacterium]|nr:helix-turn-helix domain-containing protein [Bacteroidaceae bacterium]